jgi:hypothetical protein
MQYEAKVKLIANNQTKASKTANPLDRAFAPRCPCIRTRSNFERQWLHGRGSLLLRNLPTLMVMQLSHPLS